MQTYLMTGSEKTVSCGTSCDKSMRYCARYRCCMLLYREPPRLLDVSVDAAVAYFV